MDLTMLDRDIATDMITDLDDGLDGPVSYAPDRIAQQFRYALLEIELRDARIAELEKQNERFVAIIVATDTAEDVAACLAMLDSARARIAELEVGLREACNWISDRSPDGSMLADRLRALADGKVVTR